jgi:hypothetical protein
MPYSYLIDMLANVLMALLRQDTKRDWDWLEIVSHVRNVTLDDTLTDMRATKVLRDSFREGYMEFMLPYNYMGDGLADAIRNQHSVSWTVGYPNDGTKVASVKVEGRRMKLRDARDFVMFARAARTQWLYNQAGGNETFIKD